MGILGYRRREYYRIYRLIPVIFTHTLQQCYFSPIVNLYALYPKTLEMLCVLIRNMKWSMWLTGTKPVLGPNCMIKYICDQINELHRPINTNNNLGFYCDLHGKNLDLCVFILRRYRRRLDILKEYKWTMKLHMVCHEIIVFKFCSKMVTSPLSVKVGA